MEKKLVVEKTTAAEPVSETADISKDRLIEKAPEAPATDAGRDQHPSAESQVVQEPSDVATSEPIVAAIEPTGTNFAATHGRVKEMRFVRLKKVQQHSSGPLDNLRGAFIWILIIFAGIPILVMIIGIVLLFVLESPWWGISLLLLGIIGLLFAFQI